MAEVAVIGTGYVGLTTGAYLAHLGHHVTCADVIEEKVEALRRGEMPIHEDGLEEMVHEGIRAGRLHFVLGAIPAVENAEFVFLCLPTPQDEDGSADLSYVESVAKEIGPHVRSDGLVINKSTVPVGSANRVAELLQRDDVHVVSNPEFLREGQALFDSLNPDRIVIGANDQEAAMRLAELYQSLHAPVVVTDPASAETIKYVANAFLATKISFINAVAHFCELVGADIKDVALGMGQDKRIGFEFLKPGPGWGGSCFEGSETVLMRRGEHTRLMTFAQLFAEVEEFGSDGWSVLAWDTDAPAPVYRDVLGFTARPFEGELVNVKTKMNRTVRVTPDHPFVVGDGTTGVTGVELAGNLRETHWLPVAQGTTLYLDAEPQTFVYLSDAIEFAGIDPAKVIVRLDSTQLEQLDRIPTANGRAEVRRSGTARLSHLREWGIQDGGTWSTVTNGTYVPYRIPVDYEFLYILGLYLAEGHVSVDGLRHRLYWSFHHTNEPELVARVADFWEDLGVKRDVRRGTTAMNVSVSSVLLSALFKYLGVGSNAYDKAIPDLAWREGEGGKWSLLRGLWDGDGSWSKVNDGPSVVLEYGTVSPMLADGMLRLLGDVGVVAGRRVGRTAKSTVDTYWLRISGANQVEEARWLLPDDEHPDLLHSIWQQAKRIAPTGYRRLDDKAVAWVRVTGFDREPFVGTVYSLEVEKAHTVVTSNGLIAHNCFPKDTRALIHMAEERGYGFDVLKSVVAVNNEQYERVVEKIEWAAGGSVKDKTIAVWGLTFKARTDDLRESPSLFIIERLRAKGARITAFDPMVKKDLEGITVCADAYQACEGAAALAVLTEWDEFRYLDLDRVRGVIEVPTIVDARNLLDPVAVRRHGFIYDGIGRL